MQSGIMSLLCMLAHVSVEAEDGRHGRDLDVGRLRAWQAIRDASHDVVQAVARDLDHLAGVPLEWYSVLTLLSVAPDEVLPQTQLEQRSRLSQSGVSRLVAKMQQAGLVDRQPSERDRRNLDVTLTAHGRDVFLRVTPVHHSSVQQHFGSHLSDEEIAVLTPLMQKVVVNPVGDDPGGQELEHHLPFGESVLSLTSDATAVRDIAATRDMLELPLLLDAARHVTEATIHQLRERVTSMARMIDDPEAFFRCDWDLHRLIAASCHNEVLRTLYLSLLDAISSRLASVVPTTGLQPYLYERLAIHARIVDAVASGNPDEVEVAVRAHRYTGSKVYSPTMAVGERTS